MHEENCVEHLFAGSAGRGARETIIADTACNWLCEVEGAGVGATGDEGDFWAAQHGILQHCFPTWQHDFGAGEPPDIAMIGCAATRNPSSITTTILVIFKTILLSCSFPVTEPYTLSHIPAMTQILIIVV
jgi:hypothetical protein